jgi:anti-sigma factor RsiW
MKETVNIDEWALHAYVDGELAADMQAEVEACVKADIEAAQRVEAWHRQNAALRAAYAGILDEPIPPKLLAALHRRPARTWIWPSAAAAGLALLIFGGAGGWYFSQDGGAGLAVSLASRALVAHEVYAVEVKHPVEVGANDKEHLAAWLSKRLGHPIKLPELNAEGYTLLGGRLLAGEDRPAAQLMYEDQTKRRITIFLTANPNNKESAFLVEEKGNLVACYWLDGPFGFAVAGELEMSKAMHLARVVYDEFEKEG